MRALQPLVVRGLLPRARSKSIVVFRAAFKPNCCSGGLRNWCWFCDYYCFWTGDKGILQTLRRALPDGRDDDVRGWILGVNSRAGHLIPETTEVPIAYSELVRLHLSRSRITKIIHPITSTSPTQQGSFTRTQTDFFLVSPHRSNINNKKSTSVVLASAAACRARRVAIAICDDVASAGPNIALSTMRGLLRLRYACPLPFWSPLDSERTMSKTRKWVWPGLWLTCSFRELCSAIGVIREAGGRGNNFEEVWDLSLGWP